MQNSKCSAIILSAGFSSRMKQAKFSLMFDEQRTFLEKIVEEYQNFNCEEIIVVMNSDGIKLKEDLNLTFSKNVIFVLNKSPKRERFLSLQIGLKALKRQNYIFMQNIDNPFVNQYVLKSLYKNRTFANYIIPSFNNKGGHPILLSENIVNSAINEIKNDLNLKEYLQNFSKKYVNIDYEKILININTPDVYKDFFYGNI